MGNVRVYSVGTFATPVRNVLLTGGICHSFAEAVVPLRELFAEHDIETVVIEDVDEAIEELTGADFFTIHALRRRLISDTNSTHDQARWAYELPEASGERVSEFVESGGSLLGLHTASLCFDTWYEYRRVLGGIWIWNKTHSSPQEQVLVRPTGGHAIVDSLAAFALHDEVYHDLEVQAHSQVLLDAQVADGPWQPVAWAHEWGAGRVVYDALGHDAPAFTQPGHRAFLHRAIAWLAGDI